MKTQIQSGIIEVGDFLKNPHSNQLFQVTRVTKTLAFVQWNETVEGKFKRNFYLTTKEMPTQRWDRGWEIYREITQ